MVHYKAYGDMGYRSVLKTASRESSYNIAPLHHHMFSIFHPIL